MMLFFACRCIHLVASSEVAPSIGKISVKNPFTFTVYVDFGFSEAAVYGFPIGQAKVSKF